jgi:hypothetical protein
MMSPEIAFDSELLLSALAREAAKFGAKFLTDSPSVAELETVDVDGGWSIRHEHREIVRSKVVVYATGTLRFPLLERLLPKSRDSFQVDAFGASTNKSLILVIHAPILKRVVCLQGVKGVNFIACMPMGDRTSITFGIRPTGLRDPSDMQVRDEPELFNRLARTLVSSMPGLGPMLPLESHFYMCQKIDNIRHPANPYRDMGVRHYFWLESAEIPNIFFYTPGKFTIASVAAKAFVDQLESGHARVFSDGNIPNSSLGSMPIPAIARRECFGPKTHVFCEEDGGFILAKSEASIRNSTAGERC